MTSESFHYWLALHPDIRRPIGGVKQMHRLCEAIVASGRDATLIQDNKDFHPSWFSSSVNTIGLSEWNTLKSSLSGDSNVLIVPETFLSSLPTYSASLPSVVFNQNFSYTFGHSPASKSRAKPRSFLDAYHSNLVRHILCVSDSDYNLGVSGFRLQSSKISRIINAIDSDLFRPSGKKSLSLAYMPRKNFHDAQVVVELLRRHPSFAKWDLIPIDGMSQSDVVLALQSSIGFLSFGHPEGFGLPLAEALACGCALIGYSGIGGRELFSLANKYETSFQVEFGNWQGFVDSFDYLNQSLLSNSNLLASRLQLVSKLVRSKYSFASMVKSVSSALTMIESRI